MWMRAGAVILLISATGFCADWNVRQAADYLDARQKAWLEWPATSKGGNGTCISCHTNVTYLLARPALSRALGEDLPSTYETQLLNTLRNRGSKQTPETFAPNRTGAAAVQALGTESVLAALLLTNNDVNRGGFSPYTEQAFDRMWALERNGTWTWFMTSLDPWEEPESQFYGSALAALAVGTEPGYQEREDIRKHVDALKSYLTSHAASQPMHNRLTMLWASTKLNGLMSAEEQNQVIGEILGRQQSDGGWTMASLGPWKEHPDAPAAKGSDAYATAMVTLVLQRAGTSNDATHRALDWLRAHQSPEGYWDAVSMNKHYEPGSMQSMFMRDAATAFASMALLENARRAEPPPAH
jgi:squalene-hopene/tetraprenyl-beta-curcumene cyclase